MADTNILTTDGVTAEKFMNTVFQEYREKLVTKPYMGFGSEKVIQISQDLTKGAGDAVTFNLAGALTGAGVAGSGTLEGNEEAQNYYAKRVLVDQCRNAVRIPTMSEQRTAFSIMNEAKPALTTWMAQKVEDDVFEALESINGVAYATATAGQKDAWNADNEDRVLFGAAVANYNATHATALANIDATNDILNTAQISLAKRRAQRAGIRPIKIENGNEYFVLFANELCVRDLKETTAWQQAQREALPRGIDNNIFTGMAGIYDGVIIKETTKINPIAGVGAAGIDVAMNSLCGAQAVLFAQAATPKGFVVDMVEEPFDYHDKKGVAIRSIYGIEKATFKTIVTNPAQHGVVSVFSAAVAD